MADDDDDEFTKKFNELFHKASKERETRFKKDLLKDIDTSFGAKFDAFSESMKENIALLAADRDLDRDDEEDQDPPERADPKDKRGLSPEDNARIRQAEKDAKEAKDSANKWQKEAEAEKTRNQRAEERSQLTSLLTGRVKPPLLDMVVSQLSANVVRDPEDPTRILWRDPSNSELLPLKDGADLWAKSDAGKEVAPPRNVGGAGGRGPGEGGGARGGEMSFERLGSMISGGRGSD